MGDFFHGRRRKLGCVTLVVAVLLMVGWVRSHLMDDIIRPIQGQTSLVFASSNDSLFFGLIWDMPPFSIWDTDQSNSLKRDLDSDANFKWSALFFGFGVGSAFNDPVSAALLMIPYWSLVLPLTILSAWLLLRKPGKFLEPVRQNPADNSQPS